MPETKVRKSMEGKLKEIFEYTNTWLHFAEAKNGVILTISLGILFKIIECADKIDRVFMDIFLIIILTSILSSIFSFYPNLRNSKIKGIEKLFMFFANFLSTKNEEGSQIKIFYGDIANNYSPESSDLYIKELYRDYYEEENINVNKMETDYAKEIIINSKITVNKYNYFKCSIKLTILLLIFIAIFLFLNPSAGNAYENIFYIQIKGVL